MSKNLNSRLANVNGTEPVEVFVEYKKYSVYACHVFERLVFEMLKNLRISEEKDFFSVDLYKIVEMIDKYAEKYNDLFEEFMSEDAVKYNRFLKEPTGNDKIFDISTVKEELEEMQNNIRIEEEMKCEEKNNLLKTIIDKIKKLSNITSANYNKMSMIKNNYEVLLQEMVMTNISDIISKKSIIELLK